MSSGNLIRRSLLHYWRTNLAVVAGVAVAVAVLAGALLVGDSVRGSLRNLVLLRLGETGSVVSSTGFFREQLAADLENACPIVSFEGLVTHQASGRRATGVQVHAVDDRFWSFHRRERTGPGDREILLSEALARELAPESSDGILLRVEKPSYIPAESLHGRKDDAAVTLRLSLAGVLSPAELGEFSLRPQQGAVRAAFVSLSRLQEELDAEQKANVILVPADASDPEEALREAVRLEDYGLRLRPVGSSLQLETEAGLLNDAVAETGRTVADALGYTSAGVFTYLANALRVGEREIPYSLVTAMDLDEFGEAAILLNEWAGRDLGARPGQSLTLEYYLWHPDGRLVTETAEFQVSGVIPMRGVAADRDLAPHYPGITDSDRVTDWDPPFPIDLRRIRDRDEDYWERYRTTPKAFIPLEAGQRLWESRYGKLTALRIAPLASQDAGEALSTYRRELLANLEPVELGFTVAPVREQGLEGSQGATNFGEYFVYFSFFLVVSALVLAGLFFRLGLEQRVRETGVLTATGFSRKALRRIYVVEGGVLAGLGSLLGILGAVGYAWLIVYGLRTWWIDAVGTSLLALEVTGTSLAAGALGGALAAIASTVWTLRVLDRVSPKDRLSGVITPPIDVVPVSRRAAIVGTFSTSAGALLLVAAAVDLLPETAGFFGAGTLLLIGLLALLRARFAGRAGAVHGTGVAAISRLGFRNASHRPGRAVLSVSLIASATFIIVAVDAFRFAGEIDVRDPSSGSGGYPLMAESLLPLYYSPGTPEGRESLLLDESGVTEFVSFRLRPGDDVSCLNLYRPSSPRVLGAPAAFLESARFSFQSSLAGTAAETANPWLLLNQRYEDGAVPAAVAANSLTYVLHRKLGEEFVLRLSSGRAIRFRLVAALADTVFQRELIISEDNFRRLFPDQEGYRVFLANTPPESDDDAIAFLEEALSDYGFDAVSTADQLAAFHRVENTYLSTFQTLGALGLLLGTMGLAVILLRNVLERRRELALLRAVGYRSGQLALMVLAENLLLLVSGLAIGVITALVAIVPAFAARGGHLSVASLGGLIALVLVTGLLSSVLATIATVRAPLLPALRAE